MAELRFGLIGEGNTDRALLVIVRWLLVQHLPGVEISGTWSDAGRRTAGRDLTERIVASGKAEQIHLLFVHRDADRAGREARATEVRRAVDAARRWLPTPPIVLPVVPVRMVEAWLLTDRLAIRRAADNPNGRMPLNLPRLRDLEHVADPKTVLSSLILEATGLNARRKLRFEVDPVAVGEQTHDFSLLRQLRAFQAFEADVRQVIGEQGWPANLE